MVTLEFVRDFYFRSERLKTDHSVRVFQWLKTRLNHSADRNRGLHLNYILNCLAGFR